MSKFYLVIWFHDILWSFIKIQIGYTQTICFNFQKYWNNQIYIIYYNYIFEILEIRIGHMISWYTKTISRNSGWLFDFIMILSWTQTIFSNFKIIKSNHIYLYIYYIIFMNFKFSRFDLVIWFHDIPRPFLEIRTSHMMISYIKINFLNFKIIEII